MNKLVKKTFALVKLPIAICLDVGFAIGKTAKNMFKKKSKRVTISSNEMKQRKEIS